MKLGQKGFAHLLLLLILLGGLAAGVYLATSKDPLKLFSRASEKKITNSIGTPDYVKMVSFTAGRDIEASSSGKLIYNYSISGSVSFENGSSFVRAVLVDTNNNEYLVYEGYPLISDSNNFSINNVCEETCFLNAVTPRLLRIEGNSSSLNITNTSFSNQLPLSVQAKDIPSKATTAKAQKDTLRVQKLTAAKDQKKVSWTAGETPVSKITYAEKRKLFVGLDGKQLDHLPNLQGFEYYKGGIFEIPQGGGSLSTPATLSSSVSQPSFPASWDWRNRHGENWMTSVKDQRSCGSCWAFATTGATEAVTNLYFNQHLDLNLSEQDVLSCSGAGTCAGGNPGSALNYLTYYGVVPEACFPYQGSNLSCIKCLNWFNQTVQISGKEAYNGTEGWLKQSIIKKGVISGGIYSWWHTMPLLGWETDTTDNKPVWIFKNSWGGSWGENGYTRLKLDLSDIGWTYALLTPVTTADNSYSVACVDKDNDGYCNWGIGSKPSSCPAFCKTEEDCDDSNSNLGTYNADYTCFQSSTPPPTPTPIPTILPTPIPISTSYSRVFITSTTYNGNLGGLAGADSKCQERANAANLGGKWMAWLSDSNKSAASRLIHNGVQYKLLNDRAIANNWADLTDGDLAAPINHTELNTAVKDYENVWTNTSIDGSIPPPAKNPSNRDCNNWTNGLYSNESWGYNGEVTTSRFWTFGKVWNCNSNYHLYCFEQLALTPSQTLNFQKGWNMVGLAVDKGSDYKAPDLLKDLNDLSDQSFKPAEKFTQISRWIGGGYEGHRLGYPFNDFPLVVGEGYLIKAEKPLTVTLTGSTVALPKSIQLGYGWNLISFPSVPTQINTAEKLLQTIKTQGIGAVEISRIVDGGSWDSRSNFVINPGEGYFIRVNTNPGVFNLPEDTLSTVYPITVSLKALSNLSEPSVTTPVPSPTPSPTPSSPSIKIIFKDAQGNPVSQLVCAACWNGSGGYSAPTADCKTGTEVVINKPGVCNTYNPVLGIRTGYREYRVDNVIASPNPNFKTYMNEYFGWSDINSWNQGQRTLDITVKPAPRWTPAPRRPTPTPILSTPKITRINVMSVNKVVTITGQNLSNAANVNSEQYVSVRDGKGGVLNMGSPESGGRWSANQIQFQLPPTFTWKTGYMLVFSNNKWSNQSPFSY